MEGENEAVARPPLLPLPLLLNLKRPLSVAAETDSAPQAEAPPKLGLAARLSQQSLVAEAGSCGDPPSAPASRPPASLQRTSSFAAVGRAGEGARGGPSTFMDVRTAPAAASTLPPSSERRQQELNLLARISSLPSFDPRAPPAVRVRAEAAACDSGGLAEVAATQCGPRAASAFSPSAAAFAGLPRPDFSLRPNARFSSAAPFDWAGCLRGDRAANGLAAACGAEAAESDEAQLVAALASCVHPDGAWSAEVCSLLAARDGGRALLAERRLRWQAALRSLHAHLRASRLDLFYVIADGYTALFAAPGVRGAAPRQGLALLSPTSRGLRARLRREGVPFATPLAPAADEGAQEAMAELAEFEAAHPGSTRVFAAGHGGAAGVDGTARSLVMVRGAVGVAALLNHLHEHRSSDSAKDVPLLLAPAPFEGAALRPLALAAGRALREAGGPGGGRELVHTAALSGGPVAPWHVLRLCALFARTQRGGFSLKLPPPLPGTAAFNSSAAGDVRSWADGRDGEGEGEEGEEALPAAGAALPERAELRRAKGGRWHLDGTLEAILCRDGAFFADTPQR